MGLEVDVLEAGGVAQAGALESLVKLALLAAAPLGVDEQAQALLEAEGVVLGRGELALEGVDHEEHLHGVHAVERGLGEHRSVSLVIGGAADVGVRRQG